MTYPDRRLRAFLDENVVFFRIDVSRRDPELKELFRRVKPYWSPLFLMSSSRGIELRRWFGFMTVEALLMELEIALAHDLMLQRQDAEAMARLENALREHPDSQASAEAMFWKGVAGFKAGDRDYNALEAIWSELIERWPQSTWAMRADVMEMRRSL